MKSVVGDVMRSNYWDTWKGITILCVATLHATGTFQFPTKSRNWYCELVICQFADFAVPMFLALSGYFAAKSFTHVFHDIKKYWLARFVRIIPPYLFWTAVFVLLKRRSDLLSINALDKDIFFGLGIGIGYFVIVLLQFILLTPLIMKIKKAQDHIVIMVSITSVGLLLNYLLRIQHPWLLFAQFPYYAISFLTWYPFYHLGIFIQQQGYADNPSFTGQATKFFVIYLFFVFASITEALMLSSKGLMSLAVSQIKFTSFLASISLFLFAVAFHGVEDTRTKNTILTWLGRNSYLIYLMHLLFFPRVSTLLKHISIPYNIQPVYILLQVIVVISICSFIILISKITVPRTIQKLCLGI